MAFRNLPEMPCGPILELHGQRKRFHVPYGLKRLIEDMTREVLRYQPQNIYEFLAVFMESRLQKRLNEEEKNQKRKSWEQHRWSWQGESVLEPNELKEFLETLAAPEEEVNHHAVVIQAAFRGYQARKMVKEIRKSIQMDDEQRKSVKAGLEGKEGEEKKQSQDDNANKGASTQRRNTMDITPVNATEEEIHSAVIIQAAWRGAKTRHEVKNLRASMGGGDRKSNAQNLGNNQDVQAQNQENTQQEQKLENNDTMANAQESDAGTNKENEQGTSGENGQDNQATEAGDQEGRPTEESSNANDSQQQQETSDQPTGENAERTAPPGTEGEGQTEAQKTQEGEEKPVET